MEVGLLERGGGEEDEHVSGVALGMALYTASHKITAKARGEIVAQLKPPFVSKLFWSE